MSTCCPSGLLRLCYDATERTSWTFTDAPSSERLGAPFAERLAPGSGVGLFARRHIAAGEQLIAEAPLATWNVAADASSAEKLASFEALQLSSETRQAILRLSQSSKYGSAHSLLGTWQTNGLPINYESERAPGTTNRELASRKQAAVFATICRINHSCRPNCCYEWNGRTGQGTIHACAAIPAGVELTISYLPRRGFELHARRAWLRSEHGFDCRCAACRQTGEALASSDARQRALGEMAHADEWRMPLRELIGRLDARLELLSLEQLPHVWAWKPLLYHLMRTSTAELAGDPTEACKQRVVSWCKRARFAMCEACGACHPTTMYVAAFLKKVQQR